MHRVTAADKHVFAQELALVARRWRTRCDERLKHLGVDQASWSTLYWLKHSEAGISQAQLAERANVEPPTMVRVLDRLEAQGLVERRPSLTDRRVNHLQLTAAAEPVVREIEAVAEQLRSEVMSEITFEEFQAAMSLLRRLKAKLG